MKFLSAHGIDIPWPDDTTKPVDNFTFRMGRNFYGTVYVTLVIFTDKSPTPHYCYSESISPETYKKYKDILYQFPIYISETEILFCGKHYIERSIE